MISQPYLFHYPITHHHVQKIYRYSSHLLTMQWTSLHDATFEFYKFLMMIHVDATIQAYWSSFFIIKFWGDANSLPLPIISSIFNYLSLYSMDVSGLNAKQSLWFLFFNLVVHELWFKFQQIFYLGVHQVFAMSNLNNLVNKIIF
jgi:hypothetical protein